MTSEYDIQFLFDWHYGDTVPVCRAFHLWLDVDGQFNTDNDIIVDRYEFTQEDIDWIVAENGYADISDLEVDEWYTSSEWLEHAGMPNGFKNWVRNLPEYQPYQELDIH